MVAALVDVAEMHRVAELDGARVRLFLTGDHLEQSCLARAVRADDADNAASRKFEGQVLDQHPVAKGLGDVLGLYDQIAQPLTGRNDDLCVRRLALVGGFDQLVKRLDAGLGFGLASLWR
jgi:hypothetical protein